jgi:hypothetical protein
VIDHIRNPDIAASGGASVINKSLPRMIDDDIRLDRVTAQGRDLHYNCTLVNYAAEDLDIPMFESVMTENIKSMRDTDEVVRRQLNEGRKLVYIFHDKLGQPVARIVVDKSN